MKAEPTAELVAHDEHLVELQGVNQCEHVVHELIGAIAAARRVRPAEAAQVGADDSMTLGQ